MTCVSQWESEGYGVHKVDGRDSRVVAQLDFNPQNECLSQTSIYKTSNASDHLPSGQALKKIRKKEHTHTEKCRDRSLPPPANRCEKNASAASCEHYLAWWPDIPPFIHSGPLLEASCHPDCLSQEPARQGHRQIPNTDLNKPHKEGILGHRQEHEEVENVVDAQPHKATRHTQSRQRLQCRQTPTSGKHDMWAVGGAGALCLRTSASRCRCRRTRSQKAAVPTNAPSTIMNDLKAVLSIHILPVLSKQKQEAAKGISHRRTPYKPTSHQRHSIVAMALCSFEIPASLVICSPPLTGRLSGWMDAACPVCVTSSHAKRRTPLSRSLRSAANNTSMNHTAAMSAFT